MDNKRRNLLKGGLVLGGAATFVGGYAPTLNEMIKGVTKGTAGIVTEDAINSNFLKLEYEMING